MNVFVFIRDPQNQRPGNIKIVNSSSEFKGEGESISKDMSISKNSNLSMTFNVHLRYFNQTSNSSRPTSSIIQWRVNETAIIVVDMWDNHYCKSALSSVVELAPSMNLFLTRVRSFGASVIHVPSNVHHFYSKYPQRLKVLQMHKEYMSKRKIKISRKTYRPKERQPLELGKERGCLDKPTPKVSIVWRRQTKVLYISEKDFIMRSNREELLAILHSQKLNNIVYVGVAANVCVLKRSFGIVSMSEAGFGKHNMAICRDLTDVMYNPELAPFVSLKEALQIQLDFIEKFYASSLLCK